MSKQQLRESTTQRHTERVSFCSRFGNTPALGESISINGKTLVPDKFTAYVEFHFSHALPVMTKERGALHPAVVANSYQSMQHKVFNLAHLMRSYDPSANPRDRILGTIIEVEFPPMPAGGWRVQADKDAAPGVRAVACMHKQAEQVEEILYTWFSGNVGWSVSMEQRYYMEDSGLLVHGRKGVEAYEAATPEDLRALGFVYVPYAGVERELKACMSAEENAIEREFRGQEVVLLAGGLNNSVTYKGAGLCPDGTQKEAEARVTQMLASKSFIDVGALPIFDTLGLAERSQKASQ